MIFVNLLQAYFTLYVTILWHEIGHFGHRIKYQFHPSIPVIYSENARFKTGGLVFNLIALYGIFKANPSSLLFLYFGLFNWLQFLSYTLIEPIFPLRANLFDKGNDIAGGGSDIRQLSKSLQFLFLIFGIFILIQFKDFYYPILLNLFND